jgi:hypothetical protein
MRRQHSGQVERRGGVRVQHCEVNALRVPGVRQVARRTVWRASTPPRRAVSVWSGPEHRHTTIRATAATRRRRRERGSTAQWRWEAWRTAAELSRMPLGRSSAKPAGVRRELWRQNSPRGDPLVHLHAHHECRAGSERRPHERATAAARVQHQPPRALFLLVFLLLLRRRCAPASAVCVPSALAFASALRRGPSPPANPLRSTH